MSTETRTDCNCNKNTASADWQVARVFVGNGGAEDVVAALIRAHAA